MITKLNPVILSAILDIPKKDASSIIIHSLKKHNIFYDPKDTKNVSVDIDILSADKNIDFDFYIKNIRDKYLTNPTTRGYIMNYPSELLVANKKTGKFPKTISIPKWLSQILSDEDKTVIIEAWNDKYFGIKESTGVTFKR